VKGEEASDISWRNGMVRFAKERLIRHATYSNQSGSPEIPSLHLPVGGAGMRNKINKTSTYSTSLASARYLYSRSCVVE
jgi:hypothetical protein